VDELNKVLGIGASGSLTMLGRQASPSGGLK
jgi:hypothetical protein